MDSSSPARGTPNRLINESSPYLQQHAFNPVDWYPWGEEALERARNEDKPILLSVGYSACHWCHVMERESFDDPEIAAIMNERFVCIKVDREERPDIDKIYQLAHQLLTKRAGGWPLTAFLDPHKHVPFFIGTYFSPYGNGSQGGYIHILKQVSKHYKKKKDAIVESGEQFSEAIGNLGVLPRSLVSPDEEYLEQAIDEFLREYDPVHGGFGVSPKFPNPSYLRVLQSYCARPGAAKKERALSVAIHTLEAMAEGGLYDHLGGGFFRYAVDAAWELPHFEKMLYDSAQLMPLYADYGMYTKRDDFCRVAIETAEFIMRDMQSECGGYFSTLDADSEGEEGKFYLWSLKDLENILTKSERYVVTTRFGMVGPSKMHKKEWHLRLATSFEDTARRSGVSKARLEKLLNKAMHKMFVVRERRNRPHRDEKILVSWNSLMIRAMARTGRLLERQDFIDSAERAVNFIYEEMWVDGRLKAVAKEDRRYLNAYLDDYVFLAEALLEMLQIRWSKRDFDFLEALLKTVTEHHTNPDSGGYFFTADDHEELLARSMPLHDEVTPSANGVIAQILLKVGFLIGDNDYFSLGLQALDGLQAGIEYRPSAYGSAVCAMEELLHPRAQVILRGDVEEMNQWSKACIEHSSPDTMVFPIPSDEEDLPGVLAQRKLKPDATITAYVCRERTCFPECTTLPEVLEQLTPEYYEESQS